MMEEGVSAEDAHQAIWLVDSRGLVVKVFFHLCRGMMRNLLLSKILGLAGSVLCLSNGILNLKKGLSGRLFSNCGILNHVSDMLKDACECWERNGKEKKHALKFQWIFLQNVCA